MGGAATASQPQEEDPHRLNTLRGRLRFGAGAYLALEVELVVWDSVPMPVELGIWRADQLSWAGNDPEVLSM